MHTAILDNFHLKKIFPSLISKYLEWKSVDLDFLFDFCFSKIKAKYFGSMLATELVNLWWFFIRINLLVRKYFMIWILLSKRWPGNSIEVLLSKTSTRDWCQYLSQIFKSSPGCYDKINIQHYIKFYETYFIDLYVQKKLHSQCSTDKPYLTYVLKMMVKSGLKKILLKFLYYFY